MYANCALTKSANNETFIGRTTVNNAVNNLVTNITSFIINLSPLLSHRIIRITAYKICICMHYNPLNLDAYLKTVIPIISHLIRLIILTFHNREFSIFRKSLPFWLIFAYFMDDDLFTPRNCYIYAC